ncbi:hypothetical protein M8J75_004936 [Diaphorina citri]|nr:hypothetical protein M8J75_004936 [Diaphorina citri]
MTAKLALAQGISTTASAPSTTTSVTLLTDDTPQDVAKSSDSDSSSDSEDDEAKEAERKKKEEEEEQERKRKEEEEQKAAADRSKPVSSTPVPGTPWCVVWTGDGRVFFYNPSSRTSVWERPEDLVSRSDVDKMVSSPPDNVTVVLPTDKTSAIKRDNAVSEDTEETPAKKSKVEMKSHQQQQQAPMSVAMGVSPTTAVIAPQKEEVKKIDLGKEAAMEAEVSAFSTWEKELHKIVFDPRYLLLTSKERKQVFEKYVKERAEEERKEKRNKMKEKKDEYRKLMEEANLHGKSSFGDFSSKFAKDDRFKNIEKMRERESLFNEYIIDVRRKEKEEKIAKREQVRKDFLSLLRETSEIDRHSRYSEIKKKIDSDPRYKAVDSGSLREDIFRDYIHELKEERRRQKDKDRESRRGERKEKEKDDTGARSGEEEGDGDTLMNETDKDADKKARQEASLREREKEVQRTLAVHLRDRDNEREQHKRDESIACFNALLADLVRNSELTWREAKRQLRKDHRWDSADLLDRDEKEKLFNEHIEELTKKKREKFRELLNETSEVTLSSSWKDIRKLIKEDPRYTKFSSSDRRCEREFKDYLKDKTSTAKAEFRELLQETKLISHKSLGLLHENENYLSEIEEILRNDKRFLSLEHIPEERTQIILTYLDELEKRGPPPPPTASEPNRRLGNNYVNTFGAYPKPGIGGSGDMFEDN